MKEGILVDTLIDYFKKNYSEQFEVYKDFKFCLYEIDLVLISKDKSKEITKTAIECYGSAYMTNNSRLIGRK